MKLHEMKILRYLLLLSCCICLYLFIRATNFAMVWSSLHQIGMKFTWLLMVTFIAYFMATLGWKYCFEKTDSSFSLCRLFFIRHIGETVSLINPTSIAGGEAAKVFLLRNTFQNSDSVVTSVVISRVIMILTQLLLFSFVATYLFYSGVQLPSVTIWVAAGVFILLIVIALSIVVIPQIKINYITKQCMFFTQFFQKIKKIYANMRLFYIHEKKKLAFAIVFFLLHWIFGAIEFYLILQFLGEDVNLLQAILIDMGVIFFKSAGAVVPGQIGFEELGNKIMLEIVGIAHNDVWITASILRRARQFFWIVLGIVAYIVIFKKWKPSRKIHGDIVCKS